MFRTWHITHRPHSPTPYPRVTRIPNLNNHTEHVRRASLSHFEHSRNILNKHLLLIDLFLHEILLRGYQEVFPFGGSVWGTSQPEFSPGSCFQVILYAAWIHCTATTRRARSFSLELAVGVGSSMVVVFEHLQLVTRNVMGKLGVRWSYRRKAYQTRTGRCLARKRQFYANVDTIKVKITGVCECGYNKSWPWISALHRHWCLWHSRECSSRPFSLHVDSTAVRQSSDLLHDSCEAAKSCRTS